MNPTELTNEELADALNSQMSFDYGRWIDVKTEAARRLRSPAWIKTAERLPDVRSPVYFFNGHVHRGEYWAPSVFVYGNGYQAASVTHWLPCPTPPLPAGIEVGT